VLADVAPGANAVYRNLREEVKDGLTRERLMAIISCAFGILAIALATIGLSGVLSYMLARRKNELGIRMALGASKTGVLRLILTEAASLIGLGLFAGIAAALFLGRVASTLLFGMAPYDPLSISVASALLAAIALAAAAIPALRATRLNPIEALREE
jgi:ABC-type antimicrobial peptide transport system permease subunit